MSKGPTDTRQRILDTATGLFSCHGFSATPIEDILTEVGVTKGAFYHYFKGKDHLCEVTLQQAIAAYQQLAQTLQEADPDDNRLEQWCRMLIEKQTSGQWLYYRLLTRLSIESTELNSQMQNQLKTFWLWCQHFYEILIREIDPSEASGTDARVLARVFIASHFGAVWLDRFAPAPQDVTAVCETMLKLSC